jgi:hypothetical protein
MRRIWKAMAKVAQEHFQATEKEARDLADDAIQYFYLNATVFSNRKRQSGKKRGITSYKAR